MPKASVYEANPIDPRVLEAARNIADEVVQPAIERMAAELGAAWGERPTVIAAAISETLYRKVLREDTTRWLATVAIEEGVRQEPVVGIVKTLAAIGRLAGYSRPGIERRLGLGANVRVGRHNWSPRELADEVILASRAKRLAKEDEERRREGH